MLLSKDHSEPLASRFKVLTTVLILTSIALGPLILTGIVNLAQFRSVYQAKVTDHLEALARQHGNAIDAFLIDRQSDIRVLAREHSVLQLTDSEFLSGQLNLLREEYHGAFVDLGVVDERGIQVAYAGPFNLELADYSDSDWLSAAQNREQFVSNVFAGLRGSPHFIVATVRESDDQRFIVKATIDFEAFNSLVSSIRIGRTGFAFIFNREGEYQTNPRFDVAMDQPPYADVLEDRLRADQVITVQGEDSLGRESFFTLTTLNQGLWFLAYQQQRQDALSSLHQVQTLAATVFLMAAVLAVVVSYLVSRNMSQRLAETDQRRRIMSEKVIETGRLASIGELAAGIAHEINNPVAIMVEEAGWIKDLLGEGSIEAPEARSEIDRAVDQIRTQGERCKDITYKLLSFARKTDPTVREVEINSVVEDVLGLMSQKTRYANVHIDSNLARGIPPISASPSELQQVLLNLVNNAVDAIGDRGGNVTISTHRVDDELMLRVTDTGAGIAAANLARIFDPFFTTKPVGQGTGLGLSICFGIIDRLGGRIEVDSEIDKGTTFTIYLPLGSGDDAELVTANTKSHETTGANQ